jgi:glyoxylase-like metal-dependent hydrolase (beta-lactamase superfamily II)
MLNRRQLLTAATAAAAAAATPVFARAPQVSQQVPGIYRYKIGDIEVTALLDGYLAFNSKLFLGSDPADVSEVLAKAGLTDDLPTSVNAYVVNTRGRTYLVDTGTGSHTSFGLTLGRLESNLQAAGIKPAQIDAVILTHVHPDHAEGLVKADGTARFTNAELIVNDIEYAFWTDDGALASASDDAKPFFASARRSIAPYAKRTRKVKAGEIAPGLSFMHMPGHTPGHSIVHVSSGREQLLLIGDILHNSVIQTARPDTAIVFDLDGKQAAASRRRVLDMASADKLLLSGTHVAFPGFGKVLSEGANFKFVSSDWVYTL